MSDLNINVQLRAFDKVSKQLRNISGESSKLTRKFDAAREKLGLLNNHLRDVSAMRKQRKALMENGQALTQMRERAAHLQRELGNVRGSERSRQQTEKMRAEFKRAQHSVTQLEKQQRQYQQRLRQVGDRLRQAGINTRNLTSEETRLRSAASRVNDELKERAQRLKKVAQQQQRLNHLRERRDATLNRASAMSGAGFSGLASGSAALYGMGRLINPGIEFEAAMSRVGAIARLDKNSEDFKALQEQSKALGSSTRYKATEVASGQQYLAMAGFDAKSIQAAMPDMLSLATVGNLDLGETANISSNILSAFNIPAEEMGRVADVMSAAITRTNTDIQMLGDTMKYVAPQAKTVGASLEEATAMAGLLGNIGIQGTMAGTALRSLYSRMAAPPKMAQKAMEKINLATTDAAGNMRALPDILAEVAKKTENMGNAERLAIFKHIAGEEAGSAMAALVDKAGSKAITQFADVLNNVEGEATRTASAMADNVQGDMISLASAWEGVGIAISDTNNGPMRELVQTITKIIRNISEWIQQNPELTATILKVAAGAAALAAVGGTLLITIAGFLGPLAMLRYSMGLLPIALTAVSSSFSWLGGVVARVGALMLANPIIAIAAGIALAAYLIYDNWDGIVEFFSERWTAVRRWFSDTWALLKTDTTAGLLKIGAAILDWSPLGLFYKVFAGVMDYFGIELPASLSELMTDVGARIGNAILSWSPMEWIQGVFQGAFDWLAAKFDWITNTIAWLSDLVSGLFKNLDAQQLAVEQRTNATKFIESLEQKNPALKQMNKEDRAKYIANSARGIAAKSSSTTINEGETHVNINIAHAKADTKEIKNAVGDAMMKAYQQKKSREMRRLSD